MRTAFFCWRPYQVFNAINFVHNHLDSVVESDCDLFLLDITSVTKYVSKIQEAGIFTNIYFFRDRTSTNKLFEYQNKVRGYINPEYGISLYLLNREETDLHYEVLVASGWHPFFIALAEYNSSAKIILTEDGTGSYIGDERYLKRVYKKYSLFYWITGKGPLSIKVSKIYINNISLLQCNYPYEIVEMPRISDELYDLLAKIFDYHFNAQYKEKRLIYLSQPLNEKLVDKNIREVNVFNLLEKYRDSVLLRLHPIQDDLDTSLEKDHIREMWELTARDIDNQYVLMGVFSSAQIVPKIIYNNKPTLVFLYKILLLHSTKRYSDIDGFIEKFAKSYEGKVYIPNTIKELELNLKELLG